MAVSEAELKEPHQIALAKFLAAIPASGKVKSMADDSATLTAPFTEATLKALTGVKSNPIFTTYTGYTHGGLLTKWLKDRTTTCNEFCSRCGTAMGYVGEDKNDGLGRFDIADVLTRYGRGHCWVPASSGSTPEYGDIFRLFAQSKDHNGVNLNHMGVSLFVDGKTWLTVESGQGGPSTGYDAIERKSRDWPGAALQGWVNMKALLSSGHRLDYWLGGWWEVQQGVFDVWYYWFGTGGKVICTSAKPDNLSQPPINPTLIGNFTKKGMFGVEISWQSKDVDESWQAGVQDSTNRKFTMIGKVNKSSEKLAAKRMMISGLL